MSYYDTSKLPEDQNIVFNDPPEAYRPDLSILNLGAGVQSTTVFLMMIEGEITRADRAIFADTQQEPESVYEHLEGLKEIGRREGLPVDVVTAGDLKENILKGVREERFASVPFFVNNEKGGVGMLRRQCTREFKITPIYKRIRSLLDLKPYERHEYVVEQSFGISMDEINRVRSPRKKWIVFNYPLIRARMTREDCKRWLRRRDITVPDKSACVFCPYRTDEEWKRIAEDQDAWRRAVEVDEAIREGLKGVNSPSAYVHRSATPLKERPFEGSEDAPLFADGFANECEGMCGV